MGAYRTQKGELRLLALTVTFPTWTEALVETRATRLHVALERTRQRRRTRKLDAATESDTGRLRKTCEDRVFKGLSVASGDIFLVADHDGSRVAPTIGVSHRCILLHFWNEDLSAARVEEQQRQYEKDETRTRAHGGYPSRRQAAFTIGDSKGVKSSSKIRQNAFECSRMRSQMTRMPSSPPR